MLYALSVGALLILLSVSLFSLYSSDVYSQSQQQQAVQAYWNARSGLEHYLDQRVLPKEGVIAFEHGECRMWSEGTDLVFEGRCQKQVRRLRLVGGDSAVCREEMAP